MRELVGCKNTIGRTAEVLKMPQKTKFDLFSVIMSKERLKFSFITNFLQFCLTSNYQLDGLFYCLYSFIAV